MHLNSDSPLVLVVEDDDIIRKVTCAGLAANRYRVVEAETGQKALAEIGTQHPDVVLLDMGLPDMSGLDVIRQLLDPKSFPIVVFSAGGVYQDTIAAIEAGAVDYIAKPFVIRELVSRLQSVLRTSTVPVEDSVNQFKIGELRIDVLRHLVTVGEKDVNLTPPEFRLLIAVVKNSGRLLTYRFLMNEVWGTGETPNNSALLATVAKLRNKLEPDPMRPRYLFAEMGIGYRFRDT